MLESLGYGDSLGISILSAEQGGKRSYDSSSSDAQISFEVKVNKCHVAKILTILFPGCLATGYSLSYML